MGATSIEWTDMSVNAIRAYDRKTGAVGHYCELLSSGCAHCYASNLQKRFKMPPFPGKGRLETLPVIDERGRVIVNDRIEVGLEQHALDSVLNRKKPTRWFHCDMSDMFGSWVPDVWLDKCFAVMNATLTQLPIPEDLNTKPWHTHQILTKRIDRAHRYIVSRMGGNFPKQGTHPLFAAGRGEGGSLRGRGERGADLMNAGAVLSWPLANVWLGTSCENQATADERIPWLLNTPAAIRFLSLEPLLGPINLEPHLGADGKFVNSQGINCDWVIVGGESGHGARPCNVEWIRSIVNQCQAAGVAVFVKQLGKVVDMTFKEWNDLTEGGSVGSPDFHLPPTGDRLRGTWHTEHPKGGDPAEWPEDLRVREFPKL
jgi:protein gp37